MAGISGPWGYSPGIKAAREEARRQDDRRREVERLTRSSPVTLADAAASIGETTAGLVDCSTRRRIIRAQLALARQWAEAAAGE